MLGRGRSVGFFFIVFGSVACILAWPSLSLTVPDHRFPACLPACLQLGHDLLPGGVDAPSCRDSKGRVRGNPGSFGEWLVWELEEIPVLYDVPQRLVLALPRLPRGAGPTREGSLLYRSSGLLSRITDGNRGMLVWPTCASNIMKREISKLPKTLH